MNAQQAENLTTLVLHMETKVTRTLDMETYWHVCGTPACALGEAASIHCGGMPSDTDYLWKFIEPTFGVGPTNADRLFGKHDTNAWYSPSVTPQEWAAEARKVLAENGYSMDEPKPVPSVAEKLEAIVSGPSVLPRDEVELVQIHAALYNTGR